MTARTTSRPDDGGTARGALGRGTRAPLAGVAVAGITALISGVSVFVNSYGVHSISAPAVYTTAKNLVATLVLAGCLAAARGVSRRRVGSSAARFVTVAAGPGVADAPNGIRGPRGLARWVGLAYVGVVGGGIAFVLFFDGLADTTATPAAFWRDTLVLWVAVVAFPFLRERVTWWNVTAIVVLIAGEIAIAGGVGHVAADRGELLVLAATVLWAVEVVVAKLLLRDIAPASVALVRMGVGVVALLVYLAATGDLHVLVSLGIGQIRWALVTGLLLAAYVGTWMTALARARAVDVTSVLVASAVVTALLQAAAGTTSLAPQALGLVLVAAGASLVFWANLRRRAAPGRRVVGR